MFVELEDWEQFYSARAEQEGWKISNIGPRGKPELVIESPGEGNDERAVICMMQSFKRAEPHAVAAYEMIKAKNPQEFSFWQMGEW